MAHGVNVSGVLFSLSPTKKRLIACKCEAGVLHFRSVAFKGAANIPFLGFCSLYLDV